ncbi:MAG: hypothetical protein RBS57_08450 [Desulforhabdus sp.]|jgi:hypothetical protein|nr:hypothetical protein [Desulforhabdus sp.]
MKNAVCTNNCMRASLSRLFGEHSYIILSAGVVGSLFGLLAWGFTGYMLGGLVGVMLAVTYGFIPRMADCVGECPIR